MSLKINAALEIPLNEIEFYAVRAQGPGGQHVNKSSTAVHLRFNIKKSSLPQVYKEKLLSMTDSRITKDGIIIIKSQISRSQNKNKEDALQRLADIIREAVKRRKKRKATLPTAASQKKRVESKIKHGRLKRLRGKVKDFE